MTGPSRRYVGFVRNVTIGRQGLTATLLEETVERAGGRGATSHYAAGNVVFHASVRSLRALRERIETDVASILGRREPVFLRDLESLRTLVAAKPFLEHLDDTVHERCVTFCDDDALDVPLVSRRGDVHVVAKVGTDYLSLTRLIEGRVGSPNRLVEQHSGAKGSTRKWDTIERLVARYPTS